jgi:uroporphyrinogen-III synthase
MIPTVVVTRPEPQASQWAQRLSQLGLATLAWPLMETVPSQEAAPLAELKGRGAQAAELAAVMFVSPAAVQFGLPALLDGRSWAVALGHALAAATGPGTAAALRDAGVPSELIVQPPPDSPQFDSEALWAVLQSRQIWEDEHVCIVRGRGLDRGDGQAGTGRAWLAQQWAAAGASVTQWVAYERRAPAPNAGRERVLSAVTAQPDAHVWLLSSAEALAYWPSQVDPRPHDAVATHPAVAQAASSLGFRRIAVCKASIEAVAQTVATLDRA